MRGNRKRLGGDMGDPEWERFTKNTKEESARFGDIHDVLENIQRNLEDVQVNWEWERQRDSWKIRGD
jgi:hypothetical protein